MFLSAITTAQIQLIYFTDAHQLYELNDVEGGRGGIARLKYLVDESKLDAPETYTIHGGDFVGGVLYGGIFKGETMVEAFNQIPVDIFNFGQHEFDYGYDHLSQLVGRSNGKFFSSNLIDQNQNTILHLPKYLLTQKAGLKLLWIALTDQISTTQKDLRLIQQNIDLAVGEILNSVSKNEYDQIIVLSQMDLEKNKKLIQKFPEINIILTEEVDEYHSQINYINNTPIVATAGNMSTAAKIQLSKNENPKIEIISLDQKHPKNEVFEEWEAREKLKIDELMNDKIGILEVDLDAFESLKSESLAGNLVTDAMREFYQSDFAIIDGSGIRKSVEKGEFTLGKIRTLLPFGNKIVVVRIKGRDLIQFIESQIFIEKPKLIQVSGFAYTWDKMNRKLVFQNIDENEIYTLALNEYNFQKLKQFESVLIPAQHQKSLPDYEVLKIYVKKHSIILPEKSFRIQIIEHE